MRSLKILLLVCIVAGPAFAKTYTHPIGISFVYPEDWSVRESAFTTLELIPSNPASNERGPTESYFLMAVGIRASRASDPLLVEQLKGLMKQIAPFLAAQADAERLAQPLKSAVMRWSGASPAGIQARADAYILPGSSLSIALIAIGEEKAIESRQDALRKVFATFHFVHGLRDLKLAGGWNNSTDQTYMRLRKDGRFEATQSGASSQTAPQTETQTQTQTQSAEESQSAGGKWFAGKGKLYLLPDNSTPLTFSYDVKGEPGKRVLTLHDAAGQEQTLDESALR
jgi:hypothetical protein